MCPRYRRNKPCLEGHILEVEEVHHHLWWSVSQKTVRGDHTAVWNVAITATVIIGIAPVAAVIEAASCVVIRVCLVLETVEIVC